MPHDRKYGNVALELGNVPDDEGVVVFRYRDAMMLPLMRRYREQCIEAGSPDHHIELIDGTIGQIAAWQALNPDRVQVPRSQMMDPTIPEA